MNVKKNEKLQNLNSLRKSLQKLADQKKAEFAKRFFKTRVGEYAEGDQFYGIRVPQLRIFAKTYRYLDFLTLTEVNRLPAESR